jgi:hypothetical protein
VVTGFLKGVKTKFETKQTIEETLFANRKTKKKILQSINQISLSRTDIF